MRIPPHLVGIGLSIAFSDIKEMLGSFLLVYGFRYMVMQRPVLPEQLVSDCTYIYAHDTLNNAIAGLLPPDASKHERYTQNIETHLQFTDYEYEWLVDDTVTPGSYQLGIGFYYHEVSPTFHIMP